MNPAHLRQPAALPVVSGWRRLRRRLVVASMHKARRDNHYQLIVCVAPVVVTSVLAPAWMSWLLSIGTLYSLWISTTQRPEFSAERVRGAPTAVSRRRILMLAFSWCLAMTVAGRPMHSALVVPAWTALLLVCARSAAGGAVNWPRPTAPFGRNFAALATLAWSAHAFNAIAV